MKLPKTLAATLCAALTCFLPSAASVALAREPLRQPGEVSLCLLMIIRDEEHNLRQNLHLWAPHISCYVVGLDSRTTDGSEAAVHDALDGDVPIARRHIFKFEFDGLGAARTQVLQQAWLRFTDATHLIMADPDWRLSPGTINLSELDFNHALFALRIADRNGSTSRWIDWIFLHLPGLRMRYRWHETPVLPAGIPYDPKLIGWEVSEVETHSSWHVKQHGSSSSYERYVMEISLLEKDDLDYADDPRVLYYLGIDNFIAGDHARKLASAANAIGNSAETSRWLVTAERHLAAGFRYLERRVELGIVQAPVLPASAEGVAAFAYMSSSRSFAQPDMTWAALFWLGYGYHHLSNSPTADAAAVDYYTRCAAYDVGRADCLAYLSLLQLEKGRPAEAWKAAAKASAITAPERGFMNSPSTYDCFVPQQAARAAAAAAAVATPAAAAGIAARGRFFLQKAREGCAGVPFNAPADLFEELDRQLPSKAIGTPEEFELAAAAAAAAATTTATAGRTTAGGGLALGGAFIPTATKPVNAVEAAAAAPAATVAAATARESGKSEESDLYLPKSVQSDSANSGSNGGGGDGMPGMSESRLMPLQPSALQQLGGMRLDADLPAEPNSGTATASIGHANGTPAARLSFDSRGSAARGSGGGSEAFRSERRKLPAATSAATDQAAAAAPGKPVRQRAVLSCGGARGNSVDSLLATAAALLEAEGRASSAAGACLRSAFEAGGDSLWTEDLKRSGVTAEAAKDSLYLHARVLDEAKGATRRALEGLIG